MYVYYSISANTEPHSGKDLWICDLYSEDVNSLRYPETLRCRHNNYAVCTASFLIIKSLTMAEYINSD